MIESIQSRLRTQDPVIIATIDARERLLLVLAGLFVVVTQTGLIAGRGLAMLDYWHFGVWVTCAVIGHVALHQRVPRRDPFIFPIVMLLVGWGVVVIERTAPDFAIRQSNWLAISSALMIAIVLAPGHLRWLSRYRYLWLAGGLTLLLLTTVIGRNPTSIYGPKLWLGIFDAYFQPSELLKVLLIAFLASYLADYQASLTSPIKLPIVGMVQRPSLRFLSPLLLVWGVCVLVLARQQDFGMAALFFAIFVLMLYVASGQIAYLVEGIGLLLIVGIVGYYLFGVVQTRVNIWLNPWPDADGRAFQTVQSLLAFSSGGVFGTGIGQGSPTFIPVVHSDFIFAAIGEEWGLIGTLSVVACMALLVLRGLRLATSLSARPFRSFLAAGIALTFGVQSLLIMGGTIKLIPLTGVTLPFISYGGSSLLVSFAMIGLLLVLSGDT